MVNAAETIEAMVALLKRFQVIEQISELLFRDFIFSGTGILALASFSFSLSIQEIPHDRTSRSPAGLLKTVATTLRCDARSHLSAPGRPFSAHQYAENYGIVGEAGKGTRLDGRNAYVF